MNVQKQKSGGVRYIVLAVGFTAIAVCLVYLWKVQFLNLPQPTIDAWVRFLFGQGWWVWLGIAGIPFLIWYVSKVGVRRKTVAVPAQKIAPTAIEYATPVAEQMPPEGAPQGNMTFSQLAEAEKERRSGNHVKKGAPEGKSIVPVPPINPEQFMKEIQATKQLLESSSQWENAQVHFKLGSVELWLTKGKSDSFDKNGQVEITSTENPAIEEKEKEAVYAGPPMVPVPIPPPEED